MKRFIVSIALAFSLFGATLAPAATAATCSAQYIVKPGDNLFRIGLAFGVPWPAIAAANSLSNASLIFPGQVLCILSVASASGTPAPTATMAATATGPTPSETATAAETATVTETATVAETATETATVAETATETATVTPTATGQPTPTTGPTVVAPPGFDVPTFSIVSVVKDTSVTIQTAYFPANQDFEVTMGPISGLGGTVVATTNSGQGGKFNITYTIPAQLAGVPQISIRLQSASGYYSFNWFWNITAP